MEKGASTATRPNAQLRRHRSFLDLTQTLSAAGETPGLPRRHIATFCLGVLLNRAMLIPVLVFPLSLQALILVLVSPLSLQALILSPWPRFRLCWKPSTLVLRRLRVLLTACLLLLLNFLLLLQAVPLRWPCLPLMMPTRDLQFALAPLRLRLPLHRQRISTAGWPRSQLQRLTLLLHHPIKLVCRARALLNRHLQCLRPLATNRFPGAQLPIQLPYQVLLFFFMLPSTVVPRHPRL